MAEFADKGEEFKALMTSLERFVRPMNLLSISEDSLLFYFDEFSTKSIPVKVLQK